MSEREREKKNGDEDALSKNDWCAHAAPRGTRDFDKAETTASARCSFLINTVMGSWRGDWKTLGAVRLEKSSQPTYTHIESDRVYEISRVASEKECWKMQKLVRLRKRGGGSASPRRCFLAKCESCATDWNPVAALLPLALESQSGLKGAFTWMCANSR
jgi:hypothetical protein